MMRALTIIFAALLATPIAAETLQDALVADCFNNTAIGETTPACLGLAAKRCNRSGNGSKPEIVQCIKAETAAWDKLLNQEYQNLIASFADLQSAVPEATGQELTDALRIAQRAWIAFRDGDCALQYTRWQGGTIRGIVHANCMMVFTSERSLQLRDMLEGP